MIRVRRNQQTSVPKVMAVLVGFGLATLTGCGSLNDERTARPVFATGEPLDQLIGRVAPNVDHRQLSEQVFSRVAGPIDLGQNRSRLISDSDTEAVVVVEAASDVTTHICVVAVGKDGQGSISACAPAEEVAEHGLTLVGTLDQELAATPADAVTVVAVLPDDVIGMTADGKLVAGGDGSVVATVSADVDALGWVTWEGTIRPVLY